MNLGMYATPRTDIALKKAKIAALQHAQEIHTHQAVVREAMVAVDHMSYYSKSPFLRCLSECLNFATLADA